jgi:hypothetical protein
MKTRCPHLNFKSVVKVYRLTDVPDGPVTAFTADIEIKCADCALPFRFLGVAVGVHPIEPRASADALELRAPIEPAYVTEICGRPLRSGTA